MADFIHRTQVRKGTGPLPTHVTDGFFVREIAVQSDFSFRAFGEIQKLRLSDSRHPSLLAMAHVQLVFAGNVAKLLSPPDTASQLSHDRAARLLVTLTLEGTDFSEIRTARNFFEHFDERMERYLATHKGMLIHRLIEDHLPDSVAFDDGRTFSPSFMQFLNSTTLELTLYDHTFNLFNIATLMTRINSAAEVGLLREQSE